MPLVIIHTYVHNLQCSRMISEVLKFLEAVHSKTFITFQFYIGFLFYRCRNRDFSSIIPHQPARYRNSFNEVFLDFEAFLLSTMKERSTLWIHSQIKACMDPTDCQPVSFSVTFLIIIILDFKHKITTNCEHFPGGWSFAVCI